MLAERVKEWTREWKQEGVEEGRKEGRQEGRREGRQEGRKEGRQEEREAALAKFRAVLIRELESRFGPLPQEARQRVTSLDSYETIAELSVAAAKAPSLAALGLG